jgi:CrcB protein
LTNNSERENVSGNGVLAVGIGAALGAWLRGWFGLLLNPVFPTLPLGILAANLVGGFLIGLAYEWLLEQANRKGDIP